MSPLREADFLLSVKLNNTTPIGLYYFSRSVERVAAREQHLTKETSSVREWIDDFRVALQVQPQLQHR